MSKKGKRLREFEKNNRVFNISETSKERENRRKNHKPKKTKLAVAEGDIQVSEKHKKKRNKITNTRRFVISVIMVIFITFIGVSAFKIIKLKNERDLLLEKNAELIKLKEDLTQEMENINSAEYMEQQARKQLKLIKENEILFIVPDENETEETDGEDKN